MNRRVGSSLLRKTEIREKNRGVREKSGLGGRGVEILRTKEEIRWGSTSKERDSGIISIG